MPQIRHDLSTGINDVRDELTLGLTLKRPPEITVIVCVRTYLIAKALGSEAGQAAIFS